MATEDGALALSYRRRAVGNHDNQQAPFILRERSESNGSLFGSLRFSGIALTVRYLFI
jgi:hypothetical protein